MFIGYVYGVRYVRLWNYTILGIAAYEYKDLAEQAIEHVPNNKLFIVFIDGDWTFLRSAKVWVALSEDRVCLTAYQLPGSEEVNVVKLCD